jgi:hypothetical protein
MRVIHWRSRRIWLGNRAGKSSLNAFATAVLMVKAPVSPSNAAPSAGSPGAFRVLCHAFRRGELPEFFATARRGPRQQPKKSRAHEQIVALRKRVAAGGRRHPGGAVVAARRRAG